MSELKKRCQEGRSVGKNNNNKKQTTAETLKLLRHVFETSMHLWDQNSQKASQHRIPPQKWFSFRKSVLFQPSYGKRNQRGWRCNRIATLADFMAVFDNFHFCEPNLLIKIQIAEFLLCTGPIYSFSIHQMKCSYANRPNTCL